MCKISYDYNLPIFVSLTFVVRNSIIVLVLIVNSYFVNISNNMRDAYYML